MNKNEYKKIINKLCDQCCTDENVCVLKLFVEEQHTSIRLLTQMKCVQKYKKLCENLDRRKYSWTEIMEIWIKNGRSAKFAKAYSEDKTYLQIYKEVMNDES